QFEPRATLDRHAAFAGRQNMIGKGHGRISSPRSDRSHLRMPNKPSPLRMWGSRCSGYHGPVELPTVLNEPLKPSRTDYRSGLSAWTDKSLLEEGPFYPYKTMTAEERLWWYARYSDVGPVIDFLDPILLYRRWQLVDRNPVFAVEWPRTCPQ